MAYVVTSGVPPRYEAETRLLVGPVSGDKDTLTAAGQLSQTYAALVTSELVLAATKKETGLTLSLSRLRSKIDVNANDVTRILTIRVSDGNPDVAATLANTLANELAVFVKKGLGPSAGGASTGTTPSTDTGATTTGGTQSTNAQASAALASQVQVIDKATPASKPVGAATYLIVPGAAIAGVIGALALLVALDLLGSGVRDREELFPSRRRRRARLCRQPPWVLARKPRRFAAHRRPRTGAVSGGRVPTPRDDDRECPRR